MQNHSERAKTLISKMNIHEKTAQLYAVWLTINADGRIDLRTLSQGKTEGTGRDPFEILKDGIGQITRPLGTHPINAKDCVRGLNSVQKFLVEKTRLGIPALPHEECLAGLMAEGATLFPAGINFGSLWDEDQLEKIARAIGTELYSVGGRQGLAPVLDVSRDVRWGRTEETMGEDPYLVGSLAMAYVRGLQGDDFRVLATLKHFAGHSFSEGGRNHAPVRIGEKELNDIFLLPFEMAVKLAGAGSVMPAYHDIDGEPMHASAKYLTRLLRDEWGFNGLIVADYVGISLLYEDHKVAKDIAEASAIALKAGIEMELPSHDCFREGLLQALDRNLVTIEDIDQAVQRVLVIKSKLGLFEKPYAGENTIVLNTPEHKKTALEAAEKSIVLLKNDGILPLKKGKKIALIGPLADDPLCMFSGYSFPVHLILSGLEKKENPFTTLKEAMRAEFGNDLLYARGCDILTERPKESAVFPGDVNKDGSSQKSYISSDESKFDEAVKTAMKADCIVAFMGDLAGLFLTGTVGEGSDASSFKLPGPQQKLLEKLTTIGKPLVLVLSSGRPYYPGVVDRINAFIEAWLPGQEGAAAITNILTGRTNPGGKLPVSVPKSAGAMPFFYNYKLKSAGTPIQPDFGAAYPFGFGLSYTDFAFDSFAVNADSVPSDGEIVLSCRVTNSGKRSGDETVQLYIRDMYAGLVRPVRELKGFRRVTLEPGASVKVTFKVPTDILGFTGPENKRILEPGDFMFYLGNSSRDIFFSSMVTVRGKTRLLGKRWRMQTIVTVEPA